MAGLDRRYPVELIDVVRLRGGSRVTIRPALPQDLAINQAFVLGLSDGARRSRFLAPVGGLTDDQARRFTDIDYCRHLALIAEVFVGGSEIMVAEARYVIEDSADCCEFALAILDDWQGKRLGRYLMSRLIERARAAGVRRIFGDTLRDNAAMLALGRQLGFAVRPHPADPRLYRLVLDLDSDAAERHGGTTTYPTASEIPAPKQVAAAIPAIAMSAPSSPAA